MLATNMGTISYVQECGNTSVTYLCRILHTTDELVQCVGRGGQLVEKYTQGQDLGDHAYNHETVDVLQLQP